MVNLSNVEFMLLQILAELDQASGYDINKLIDQRGYRQWAHIGTTSVYTGLKKLNGKGMIMSEHSGEKSGKGPMPTRFVITDNGTAALKDEVLSSLSTTRERDQRFDLALAALPFIEKDEAIEALRKRLDLLSEALMNIKQTYESQGGARLPLHVRSLFQHPLNLIESEHAFVMSLIHELSEARD
ncbi:PadR family transcriptional regulator [Paenibacillus sp. MDMC362]|uniref:PadR family transcriptional regulator n=1 Tax=Paenibacillus sp. MDMC362 TaxID=2977365 RepID=UPI000DC34C53|nr:PadR family transcriptional regulator [Paenibacillus sp. MDMC362]RAR43910.1 PadR family transcriptional regulator [Paenibacillus sp. MDMC362]